MTTRFSSRLLRAAACGACLLALFFPRPAFAQDYAFTTLAGAPGGSGSTDGIGRAARFSSPVSVAVDAAGNLFVADTGNHTIRKVTADGIVTTLAGSPGARGIADGPGQDARFNAPGGVAVDAHGNVFVADTDSHTIRRIGPDGVVTTIAGTAGAFGHVDGRGSEARFYTPRGIAVDNQGNLFVADATTYTLRKITADGNVTTLAGLPYNAGTVDGTSGGARFENLEGLAIDASGNLYLAQGYNGGTIRKVTAAGVVTTVAGTPRNFGVRDGPANLSVLSNPRGVAVDRAGNVFIADTASDTIRELTVDGFVLTLAGSAGNAGSLDGPSGAQFNQPAGIAVDANGNVYVADSNNHNLRKIAAGVVTTLAGGAGAGDNDGPADAARFNGPRGVATDTEGNVFVTDAGNFALRKISASGTVSTLAHRAIPFEVAYLFGVTADRQGNVYFAEHVDGSDWWSPNGSSIQKLAPDGGVTTFAGSPYDSGSDDGKADRALFDTAQGVAVDALGNVFVADTYNHMIRRIAPDGFVTTFAGSRQPGAGDNTGTLAHFNYPQGIAVGALGDVFVADTSNHTIRKISPAGVVTTLAGSAGNAGSADGPGGVARFNRPHGLAVDADGNVLVADTSNHTLRRIAPDGFVTTVAGLAGNPGSADGNGRDARFNLPTDVALDRRGRLYVADSGSNVIRLGTLAVATIVAQPQSQTIGRGRTAMLGVTLAGAPIASYQWWKDDVALAGATEPALVLANANAASAGTYRCVVTTAGGSVASAPAIVTLGDATEPGRFNNFSARVQLEAGRSLIAGLVLNGRKTVLVRGVGPALAAFDVSGVLADPKLALFDGTGQLLAENDDWPAGLADVFAAAGAFALPRGGKDAALLLTLPAGAYTVALSEANGAAGEGLLEIYEVP